MIFATYSIKKRSSNKISSFFIKSNWRKKIDTNTGFCNDRTPSSGTGTGTTKAFYAAYNRLDTNKKPSFKCTNSSDLFTIRSSNKGNKALQYPIGLITADEVAYAGGVDGRSNTSYYLYADQDYWTMSPRSFDNSGAYMFRAGSGISNTTVNRAYGVRPVINLKADVTISSGDGTASNPYVI